MWHADLWLENRSTLHAGGDGEIWWRHCTVEGSGADWETEQTPSHATTWDIEAAGGYYTLDLCAPNKEEETVPTVVPAAAVVVTFSSFTTATSVTTTFAATVTTHPSDVPRTASSPAIPGGITLPGFTNPASSATLATVPATPATSYSTDVGPPCISCST